MNRHERTNEREEAAQEHSQRAPLFNHALGFGQSLRSQRLHLAGLDNTATKEMTDEVVALVADNRRAPNHRQQPEQRQRGLAGRSIRGCEHAGREQQRITGQEREEHHARFDEYDEEDEAEGRRHAHGNPTGNRGTRILRAVR